MLRLTLLTIDVQHDDEGGVDDAQHYGEGDVDEVEHKVQRAASARCGEVWAAVAVTEMAAAAVGQRQRVL